MNNDIVAQLRLRACSPEGEYLEHDHGHSDCYLEREAADEIERLRTTIKTMEQQMKEIHWSDPVTITIPYEEALSLAECTGFTKTFHIGGGHPLQKAALKALEEQYAYTTPD
jgi:hypothetical protein